MAPPLLTKSSFMRFVECPVALWLERVRPELKPPVAPDLQRVFDTGNLIDGLARGLFPGGVEIQGYNARGFENTKAAIAERAQILYQPTAVADGLSARADILVKGRGGKWELHEVKSSTEVKDDHPQDLAFQRHCFESAGIPIGKTFLVHVDNGYVRQGAVDVHGLLVEEDITATVDLASPEAFRMIQEAKKVLSWPRELEASHLMTCPDLTKCEWVKFWLDRYDRREEVLAGLDPVVVAKMLENGVIDIAEYSPGFVKSVPYRTPEERWPRRVDKRAVESAISALRYPLHFLDFETYHPAIPPFDGYRPYQQIPFQFSAYVIDAPGAEPRLFDFLMDRFEDPAQEIVAAMREAIGPEGSVIAWNISFEKGRDAELAEAHPEHADFLLGANGRMYDLMLVFKPKAGMYVDPGFRGSASLKQVMPVVVPELSYKALNIQEGDTASASWPIVTDPDLPEGERAKLKKDMIDYCRLDVYAMVRILERLREIAGE